MFLLAKQKTNVPPAVPSRTTSRTSSSGAAASLCWRLLYASGQGADCPLVVQKSHKTIFKTNSTKNTFFN